MPLLFDELPLLERLRLYGPVSPQRSAAGSVVYPPVSRAVEHARPRIRKTAGRSHVLPAESKCNEV